MVTTSAQVFETSDTDILGSCTNLFKAIFNLYEVAFESALLTIPGFMFRTVISARKWRVTVSKKCSRYAGGDSCRHEKPPSIA